MKLVFERLLYLTADPEQVRRQLDGERLAVGERALLAANVSTDEMTPGWACYYYDERLGHYCLVGFRGGVVQPGSVRQGNYSALVGGTSFGCGSSRETAPFAQRAAGIRLILAHSFERIYRQNCHNLGLWTSTDLGLVDRLERGETIDEEELSRELDAVTRAVVQAGGLGAYGRRRLSGGASVPELSGPSRPQTLVEKILASHTAAAAGKPAYVSPGDVVFARADVRFSHDYVTAMIDAQFRAAFGDAARVAEPDSVFLFRDHLALLGKVMPDEQRRLGLLDRANELAAVQRVFAERHSLRLFDELPAGGTQGICHNLVIEQLAMPGDVVVGTDSHTCMAGVLGCVAFGVGSTDMAAGFLTRDFRVNVPESVRVELIGRLPAGTCAKDAWLSLLADPLVKDGLLRGRVLELCGQGYAALSLDERATLTNMAVEASAFTAIGMADEVVVDFLVQERGVSAASVRARLREADPDAHYAAELELSLSDVEPMIALPGDPRNGMALRELLAAGTDIPIHIAYGGSCTGGKRADMDMYASVARAALERGERVAPGVQLFIQFGSQSIHRYAERRGYIELFTALGASLVEPSCGACIRAGPGVSTRAEQVSISAINRNFPGRSGPGQVYLGSPLVVAASAVAGKIVNPPEYSPTSSARRAPVQLRSRTAAPRPRS
ncbi:MAG TPA: aconitase family protein [Polyangiaceae bacterium]|nr:aconitase family protein [Polyangiaceae bacterium]